MDDNVGKPEEAPTKVKDEFKDRTEDSQTNDVKPVDAAITPPKAEADATANAGSRKRAREDDDGVEEQRSSKKADLKVEE